MKTYTHCKLSLLAVLLSLHTLSACVQTNTRQEIDFTKSIQRTWRRCNLTGKVLLVSVPLAVTGLAASAVWGVNYAINKPNGTNLTSITPFPPTVFPTTLTPFIEAPVTTTTEAPLIVKDPNVIDDTILAYLEKNDFSKASIERLWGPHLDENPKRQYLDKNAKDKRGCNMLNLIALAKKPDPAVVEFLNKAGVDPTVKC